MVPWVCTAEVRFSSLSQPLYAKQKGARGGREQLAHSDVPQWSREEVWVWWHWWHWGQWHCCCLLPFCGDAGLLPPAVPHKPTDPKTHPCPSPRGSCSPSCPSAPSQVLSPREKPGALLVTDLLLSSALRSILPPSADPGSCREDLGGTGDMKSSLGAGLHPRLPCSSTAWSGGGTPTTFGQDLQA